MMKQRFLLLFVICFLGACTREASSYQFDKPVKVKVDESTIVLTGFPARLQALNDSTAGMIVNQRYLSLYDLNSGKNILNFSADKIDFDSLLQATYQQHYAGQRNYLYDSSAAGGLTNGSCQLHSFYFADNKFYIYANAEVEVQYINDSAKLAGSMKDPKVQAVQQQYGNAEFHFMEFAEFMFVTDEHLRLQKIIPSYPSKSLDLHQATAMYQLAFAADEGSLYSFLIPKGDAYQDMRSPIDAGNQFYSVAKIPQNNPESAEFLFSNKDVDYKDFSVKDYYSNTHLFKNSKSGLCFLTGKEIYLVGNGKPVFAKGPLPEDEWINSFFDHDNHIVMTTTAIGKKKNPSKMDVAYAVDSVTSRKIRVYDKTRKSWTCTHELPLSLNTEFDITRDKVIYLEKDKDNYYFTSILYHED